MRSPLAYAPRPGAARRRERAAPRASYLGSLAVVAFAYSNPIVLAGAGARRRRRRARRRGAGAALRAAARWGLALGLLIVVVNATRRAARRHDPARAAASCRCSAASTSAPRRSPRARSSRCASRSCSAPSPSTPPASTPTGCCACCGRWPRRSALTATLITRLVPLAAADDVAAARRRGAARPGGGAGRARRARPPARRRLARPRRRRRRDARAARLRARGPALGRAAGAGSRHDWRFVRRRRCAIVALGDRRAARRASAAFDAYPAIAIDADPATLALAAGAARCSPRCRRRTARRRAGRRRG